MGVRAVLVPERLLPDVPPILSSTGASVSETPGSDEQITRGFLCIFTCATDRAEVVRIECVRSPHAPGMLVLVLKPIRGSGDENSTTWLLTRVESALRKHGATDV